MNKNEDYKELANNLTDEVVDLRIENEKLKKTNKELTEQLRLGVVGISCVKEKKLIEELDDKRIVGVKLTDDMWYYSRKETAQHLLDKYEIKPK